MSAIILTSGATFQNDVIESPIPVVVIFGAPACPPCRELTRLLEKMAAEFAGRIKLVKVDIDAEFKIAVRYEIGSVPTLLFFSRGECIRRSAGSIRAASLRNELTSLQEVA